MAKSTTSPDLDDKGFGDEPKKPLSKRGDQTKRTVKLAEGGTLTLDIDDVNLLDLGTESRNFLFTLIDHLEAYDRAHQDLDKAVADPKP